MISCRKFISAGIALFSAAAVSAQFQIHDAWSGFTKYTVHHYDFSATTAAFPLMTVTPVGDVKWAGYQLYHPTTKCFYVRTSQVNGAMDTRIWSEHGGTSYSDDRVDGNRYAAFLWWNNNTTLNFRLAAFSPAYNNGAFRLDVNEISSATTETACSNYNTGVSFIRGTTVVRHY